MLLFPPRRILVAFDFSGRSFRAWEYAEALAERCGARLEAVHVHRWTRLPSGSFVSAGLRAQQRQAIKTAMARLLPDSSQLRIVEGDVVAEILRAARELRADLILMATEGRTGARGLKRPSVTEAVARRSPVPVLSLRRGGHLPGSILVPLRLEGYAEAALKVAEEAAKVFGARLTLLHVKDPAERSAGLRRLEALAESVPPSVPVELKVREGESVQEIVEESTRYDLVALVAHRRGGARDTVLGTTVEQVLRQASAPVLSVPVSIRRERPARSARPRRSWRKPAPRARRAPGHGRGNTGRSPSSTRPARPG